MGANFDEAVIHQTFMILFQKAWEGRQKLLDQNLQLENATKVGYDMEQIAVDIKTNLNGQTAQMNKVSNKMGDINQDMTVSNKIMTDISKNRRVNKFIFYGILLSLILVLILIIVFKFV